MKKILFLILTMLLMLGMGATAYADFPERPVGLVVLDHSGSVDASFYRQNIYAPVKWAYHFPNYKIQTNDYLDSQVATAFSRPKTKVTPELMQELAKANNLDVLVVADINEVSETIVPSIDFRRWGSGPLTRVICWADLYCYRLDKNKLLKKRLRDNFLADGPSYEPPRETVKWQLSKLVNTMEDRPIIE